MADGAYTASVLPQAKVAAAKVGGLQDQVSAWLRANQQVAMVRARRRGVGGRAVSCDAIMLLA